ncbi:MAG: HAD family phosphatase [Chitinispirillaceae bacterium]|nr:HAD family phosphatase [Chitinispirillaceae bacterium]
MSAVSKKQALSGAPFNSIFFAVTMDYRLFAFDLDGTLLNDRKQLSPATSRALEEIAAQGGRIVFATGRLGSSMSGYVPSRLDDIALLTLNGAEVRTGRASGSRLVHYAPLSAGIADYLIGYGADKGFALNYYLDGTLYAVRNERSAPWIDLYFAQTGTAYRFVESLDPFLGNRPSKVIFVGDKSIIDDQEAFFRRRWGHGVYICRTWDHYLEFLDPVANKADGLDALLKTDGIEWHEVVAFGDAENDIPMLQKAGLGIAMANAPESVKNAADRVSKYGNNDDGVAREWESIKQENPQVPANRIG